LYDPDDEAIELGCQMMGITREEMEQIIEEEDDERTTDD
jgi:hypothetical protein